jgi:hypothetical protein
MRNRLPDKSRQAKSERGKRLSFYGRARYNIPDTGGFADDLDAETLCKHKRNMK